MAKAKKDKKYRKAKIKNENTGEETDGYYFDRKNKKPNEEIDDYYGDVKTEQSVAGTEDYHVDLKKGETEEGTDAYHGAVKKEKTEEETDEHLIKPRSAVLSPIAHPLAQNELCRKVLKVMKEASECRHVERGVDEVLKGLRKGYKGIVVMAGDTFPLDVISHVPVLCEDAGVPYVFVPSKEDIRSATSTARCSSCVMVVPGGRKNGDASHYKKDYDECFEDVKELNASVRFELQKGSRREFRTYQELNVS